MLATNTLCFDQKCERVLRAVMLKTNSTLATHLAYSPALSAATRTIKTAVVNSPLHPIFWISTYRAGKTECAFAHDVAVVCFLLVMHVNL
jgi:hypothetical protein